MELFCYIPDVKPESLQTENLWLPEYAIKPTELVHYNPFKLICLQNFRPIHILDKSPRFVNLYIWHGST